MGGTGQNWTGSGDSNSQEQPQGKSLRQRQWRPGKQLECQAAGCGASPDPSILLANFLTITCKATTRASCGWS